SQRGWGNSARRSNWNRPQPRQRHNSGLRRKHPAPRPRKRDRDQGKMQGDEETLQAKRRENQTGRLRKVRKDSAEQSQLAPSQRLRLDSQASEGEEIRHRDGGYQRNPQALPKGERTGQRIQGETQLMELLRIAETDRIQGEMGRNTSLLRGSER